MRLNRTLIKPAGLGSPFDSGGDGVGAAVVERARLNIGDFDLGEGRRFRVYADWDWTRGDDSVTVSRVHPDPAHGKALITASGLDAEAPEFKFPEGWGASDREAARRAILAAWRTDWRTPQMDAARGAIVQPIYFGHRRLRLLRRLGLAAITAELMHPDGCLPTWAATVYRLGGSSDRYDTRPLLRVNWALADWLGRDDGDPVGVEARQRLRTATGALWDSKPP